LLSEHKQLTRIINNNIDIVKYCQYCFGFEMPSELWAKRISKLNEKKSLIVATRSWL